MSFPAPPATRSSPAPPISVSSPAPPLRVSLPPAPLRLSFPPAPSSRLSLLLPVMTLLSALPVPSPAPNRTRSSKLAPSL
ncbi:MAG: hypothetical protein C0484_08255 [Rhodospirillum sp.]|nr:hypothetical protein [Rhodospirillum sp.]